MIKILDVLPPQASLIVQRPVEMVRSSGSGTGTAVYVRRCIDCTFECVRSENVDRSPATHYHDLNDKLELVVWP